MNKENFLTTWDGALRIKFPVRAESRCFDVEWTLRAQSPNPPLKGPQVFSNNKSSK